MRYPASIMSQASAQRLEAVVFLEDGKSQAAGMKVGGLPLLKRTWRILKRAGIRRVTLVGGQDSQPYSRWASELGLELTPAAGWQADGRPAVLFPADLAFQHDFFTQFLGNWTSSNGQWRTLAVSGEQAPAVAAGQGLEGRFSSFEDVQQALQRQAPDRLARAEEVSAACLRISSKESAQRFHRLIEKTMVKATDGLFARWNRKISIPLTRLLAHLPITPNMVTYLTLLVSIWGAYWLSRGGYFDMLVGALLTQLASILDGNDGELARLKILDSDYGTWLDTICDYISYFFTFGGVAYGLYNRSGSTVYLMTGGVMFGGIILAMLLTSRLRRKYTGDAGAAALTKVVVQSLDENKHQSLLARLAQRLRHFGTRATFSYYLVAFALLDAWPVLLGIVALGAQFYWMGILYNEKFLKKRG